MSQSPVLFCLLIVLGPISLLSWLAIPEPQQDTATHQSLCIQAAPELLEQLAPAIEDLQFAYKKRMAISSTARSRPPEITLELAQQNRLPPNASDLPAPGSFSITGDQDSLLLQGHDPEGIQNALYALCRDWLGARWYWAGELGFELVESGPLPELDLPWSESPAFSQRKLFPIIHDYARRNRLNHRYRFNHNLAKIFNKERYAESTEGFSLINGQYPEPNENAGLDANPNFTSARAVELSAQAALQHFAEHPESVSFSLSVNDNVLFDESDWTQQAVEPLEYFRRRPNYTDLVFHYMNLVARKVFDEAGAWQTPSGQPRYLTALAYYWTEQSPNFSLHPRVMPILTSDRAQWHDPNYRIEDKALIQRWANSGAERIATWDYYFGSPYPYPRQFNQWIDESLKHLHANGVDAFFSQLPSAWGLDGPKAWLAAELLWDPQQSAHSLLDEYYTHFFRPSRHTNASLL